MWNSHNERKSRIPASCYGNRPRQEHTDDDVSWWMNIKCSSRETRASESLGICAGIFFLFQTFVYNDSIAVWIIANNTRNGNLWKHNNDDNYGDVIRTKTSLGVSTAVSRFFLLIMKLIKWMKQSIICKRVSHFAKPNLSWFMAWSS